MFGDGGTSRGEFHSAMNFAGIHRPPAIYLCANNCWAVTTPLDRQTAMDNFAAKADAYNVRNLRIDGNDPLAAYAVVKEARDKSAEFGATLIEAVTYRLGFHTSSDNPDLYRMQQEAERWEKWDPVRRTRLYMEAKGWWSEDEQQTLEARYAEEIQAAVDYAQDLPVPGPADQFDQHYAELDWILTEQRERLLAEVEWEGS